MEDNQKLIGRFAGMRTWAPRLVIALFVILFLIHFHFVWKSAVNIPSDDEWVVFQSPTVMSFSWIWSQHNEHRIVTTKFLIWLQYRLDGWNHETNLVIDFIIFGLMIGWLIWVAKKLEPTLPLWVIVGFAFFLLSPILWMDHLIGLQVCFHFWLLFFLVSAYLLFDANQNWRRLSIGCCASALSLYSLGTGLMSQSILLVLFTLFKVVRAYTSKSSRERLLEIRQLILVVALNVGAVVLMFVDYQISSNNRGLALPYELSFWRLFLNLVSFAFGIDAISTTLGAICLLIVTTPIIWQVWQQRGNLSSQQWTSYAVVLSILGTLASVAAGRAPFGIEWSKTSRYFEIGMPLIVFSVLNWRWTLHRKPILEATAIASLWFFCLVTFSNNWSFEIYGQRAASRQIGAQCVKAYYQQGGTARCPQLFSSPLAPLLDLAKVLDVSFYRDLSAQLQREGRQPVDSTTESTYEGVLDVADCERIGGWASRGPKATTVLKVDIFDGDKLIDTVVADIYRADVHAAGLGAFFSGFDIPTSPMLKDGKLHSIRARIAGTSRDLRASPKPLTCSPP